MEIRLVYISENQSYDRDLSVNEPCTLRQALEQSGILRECPEINLSIHKVGIFGKLVSLETSLHSGDRIEIYRPLKIDPKESRRRRAKVKDKGVGLI